MAFPRSFALALVAALLAAAALGAAAQNSPTPTDCANSVANCNTCRYQFFRGTTTKAICTKCEIGYVVKASGRSCYCAPGYFTPNDTSVSGKVGFTCLPCGKGAFCPGAKVTARSSSVRVPCGLNKLTTTEFGRSDLECMVEPGYGWAAADGSTICPVGSYNPGYNARKCTPCAGGLTTNSTGCKSSQECVAGQGMYYLRGKAVACARGTYKGVLANQDCDKCPEGFTTPNNTVPATDKSQCTVLMPGYQSPANPTIGETPGAECPADTYREGELPGMSSSSGAVDCTPCGGGLVTLPNTTRASSPDACLAAPGYSWWPSATNVAGAGQICPNGTYNPGYNREKCINCGDNLFTDTEGKTNSDDCYTAAGWGNERSPDNRTFVAYICPLHTYGRPANVYGLYDVGCVKCATAAITLQVGSKSEAACLAPPGMGWEDGEVQTCEYAWYNEGYNRRPCQYCGDFYNTTNLDWSYNGERGSDSPNDCKIDFGFVDGICPSLVKSSGILPCIRGYYKDTVSNTATCQLCPTGTSTSRQLGAVAMSDCNTCRPGFGLTGKIDLTAPRCNLCRNGFWSSGYVNDGQPCAVCPQAANFTGRMVSRDGVWTPEDCYGEYTTDGEDPQNRLWWDFIPMNSSTLIRQPLATSSLACQTACTQNTECQYFTYYWKGGPEGNGEQQCYHRLAGPTTKISTAVVGGDWDNPKVNMVLFEIRERHYVVYPKTADEVVGITLQEGVGSFLDARFGCDANRECVGLTWDPATKWRLFTAALWEDAIGKYKVVGEDIDSWLEVPTGNENTELWTATCLGNVTGGLSTSGSTLSNSTASGNGTNSGSGGGIVLPPKPSPKPKTSPSPSPSPSPPGNTENGFVVDDDPSPSPSPIPSPPSPSPTPDNGTWSWEYQSVTDGSTPGGSGWEVFDCSSMP